MQAANHLLPTPPSRLLRRLEEEQRQRHTEFLALMNRSRVELAALLGGVAAVQEASAGGVAKGDTTARPPACFGMADKGPADRAEEALHPAAPDWGIGGQVEALGGRHMALPHVPEVLGDDEEEAAEHGNQTARAGGAARQPARHSQQQQHQHQHLAAVPAITAAPTPAVRERAHRVAQAAAAAAARPTMARQVAGSRKRFASYEVDAAPAGVNKRRAGRRRSSETEATAVSADMAAGGTLLGKRICCRSSDKQDAAATAAQAVSGAAPSKRGRRG